MKTKKHPKDLTDAETDALIAEFDDTPDEQYTVTSPNVLIELRAAAASRREAEGRVESAVLSARRSGLSWGVIGTQLGLTRQGARQRYERLIIE